LRVIEDNDLSARLCAIEQLEVANGLKSYDSKLNDLERTLKDFILLSESDRDTMAGQIGYLTAKSKEESI